MNVLVSTDALPRARLQLESAEGSDVADYCGVLSDGEAASETRR